MSTYFSGTSRPFQQSDKRLSDEEHAMRFTPKNALGITTWGIQTGFERTNEQLSEHSIICGTNNFVGPETRNVFINGEYNKINDYTYNSAIVGGSGNTINASNSTIIGGTNVTVNNEGEVNIGGVSIINGVISGGTPFTFNINYTNAIQPTEGGSSTSGDYSVIGGGSSNLIDSGSTYSVIAGGLSNQIITSEKAFIGGGQYNYIDDSSTRSSIVGGYNNLVTGSTYSHIGGGDDNTVSSSYGSIIVGGQNNTVSTNSGFSIIGGGVDHIIDDSIRAFIGAGSGNDVLNSDRSSIVGGFSNTISGSSKSAIVGGDNNTIQGTSNYSFIGGGISNLINDSVRSSVVGGSTNQIIGGGRNVIGGGFGNQISGSSYSSILAGAGNRTDGYDNVHILGTSITATKSNTTYVDALMNEDNGTVFRELVLDIDDWNMDSTATKSVAHGLSATEWKTIRDISVIIRNDGDSAYYDIESAGAAGTGPNGGGITNFAGTNVNLYRITGGLFDTTGFDSTSYNRGWIKLTYTPD